MADAARKAIADLSARAVFKGSDARMDPACSDTLKAFAHALVGRNF